MVHLGVTLPRWAYFAFDLAAISILAFGIYFPRYRRRDLLLSYLAVNVGVMAVTVALTETVIGAGVALGLFGVLSIVRLRSAELAQQEIAYYFAALSLGLLGGVDITPGWLSPALSVAILLVMALADHPLLYGRYRYQVMTLDRAFTDESQLTRFLEQLLGADVRHLLIKRVDLVTDTTVVDVRYRLTSAGATRGLTPGLYEQYRNQSMTVDRAFTDEVQLTQYLEQLLAAEVHHLHVRRIDLVNDTTLVDVRYRLLDDHLPGTSAVDQLDPTV